MSRVTWPVAAADSGARLDHFVAARAGCSHAAARRLIESGAVRVGGRIAAKGSRVHQGEQVSADGPLPGAPLEAEPDLPLEVVFSDGDLVALAKPAGMPSHPLRPGERGTLAGALVARFPECRGAGADPREAGLVQRLDVDTSGILLAARSASAWQALRSAFSDGRVEKIYLALAAGSIDGDRAIDLPIAHHPGDPRRVIAVEDLGEQVRLAARPAHTKVHPVEQRAGLTLIEATSSTGRMHQIRAHLAHLGHPLVGDTLYGGPPALDGAPGHFLHAARIRFPDPSGTIRELAAPLPKNRADALARLGFHLS
jgi:23S rRNA pseudouridine1911/1915/1917 synthase